MKLSIHKQDNRNVDAKKAISWRAQLNDKANSVAETFPGTPYKCRRACLRPAPAVIRWIPSVSTTNPFRRERRKRRSEDYHQAQPVTVSTEREGARMSALYHRTFSQAVGEKKKVRTARIAHLNVRMQSSLTKQPRRAYGSIRLSTKSHRGSHFAVPSRVPRSTPNIPQGSG